MKRIGRVVLIAVPSLVIGLVLGTVGGFRLYEAAFGGAPESVAGRAVDAAVMLRGPQPDESQIDSIVALRLADEANRNLALAATMYSRLDAEYRAMLFRAAQSLESDARSVTVVGTDFNRRFAQAARSCILAGGEPAVVQECAKRSDEEIRARYCTEGGVCRFTSTMSDPPKVVAASGP